MEKIKVHDKVFRLFIPREEIYKAIDKVADKINKGYAGSQPAPMLLCVLNGGLPFTSALMRRLNFDCELQSVKVSSYDGIKSTGHLTTKLGPTADVRGRRIIVCEDIVDTGITIRQLQRMLLEMGAVEVKVCSLLLKRGNLRRQLESEGILSPTDHESAINPYLPEFYGLDIADDFIVGFGLDYNELGRCYEDIYVLDEQGE